MKAIRRSNYQLTILNAAASKGGIPLDEAVRFNQVSFLSLVEHEPTLLALVPASTDKEEDSFVLTEDGYNVWAAYFRGRAEDIHVKTMNAMRTQKVIGSFGRPQRRRVVESIRAGGRNVTVMPQRKRMAVVTSRRALHG